VPRFGWRYAPIIIAAISESNWRFNEFYWISIVEGGQLNCNVVTSDFFNIPTCERTYTTVLTEEVVANPIAELIVSQVALAGQ